jgi:ATP-dependent helicase/DNAse subunit B
MSSDLSDVSLILSRNSVVDAFHHYTLRRNIKAKLRFIRQSKYSHVSKNLVNDRAELASPSSLPVINFHFFPLICLLL